MWLTLAFVNNTGRGTGPSVLSLTDRHTPLGARGTYATIINQISDWLHLNQQKIVSKQDTHFTAVKLGSE